MLGWFQSESGLDDRGFESRQGVGIYFFTTASRPALGCTQLLIQWMPGTLSLGVKRPGREAIPSLPQYAFMAWCSFEEHWDSFTFIFTWN